MSAKIVRDRKPGVLRIRGPQYPVTLPCGCRASAKKTSAYKDVLLLCDGKHRVCRHGFVWKLAWLEVGRISKK